MPDFIYEAVDQQGESLSGHVTAETVAAAIEQLESQGLVVQSIRQVQVSDTIADSERPAGTSDQALPLSEEDQRILHERMQNVLERREVLAPALAAYADEMRPGRARRELHQLAKKLERNVSVEE